ncbi:MAG: molybdopterin-dependent oxidoreductase [Coriobacteriales bacterium]|jgi:anaerobic dimethyl sulfoxide reductase subunit A|nr:molybdopterin-dependent oxidoreductase [Coriobacteriales bacterium]
MGTDKALKIDKPATSELSRRGFVKWSALVGGTAALSGGLFGCGMKESERPPAGGDKTETGSWKTVPCIFNCSGGSRCYIRAYMVDDVPTKIITDQEDEDSVLVPQRRACLRGRAQISNMLSADRVKYPMKRKGWSSDNPNGTMRGKDEWERVSWDEAIELLVSQTKKCLEIHGERSIFVPGYDTGGSFYFDPNVYVFAKLGTYVNNKWANCSFGSWPISEMLITGGLMEGPDYQSLSKSKLQVYFGNNWQANKGGSCAWRLSNDRDLGTKIVIIDPWLNQTAQAIADEWIPVRPGTDTALILGMAYHQITGDLQNQEFLDTYCVGFDAEHMPDGTPVEDNFKDYVLGTFDGVPKTPEWAEPICGTSAEVIKGLAEEIAAAPTVAFFGTWSASKIPAGESFCQAFYTFAFMHGVGTPGNSVSWYGVKESYLSAGDFGNAGANPKNTLLPPMIFLSPDFSQIENWDSWDLMEMSTTWESILAGEYGVDSWPQGKKKLNIHMIYVGPENSINSTPAANKAIEVFRAMDFVVVTNPWFCSTAQYADLVLPAATNWEKNTRAWVGIPDTIYWQEPVMTPLYEAKHECEIARLFAEGMGMNPDEVDTATQAERTYATIKESAYVSDISTGEHNPLFTITQEDLDALGVAGEPQEGLLRLDEFKQTGMYKAPRTQDDALVYNPYEAFIVNPVANPLPTASGKFEIYCVALAGVVNSFGFSTIYPIGKYIPDDTQGWSARSQEYPLLLWTPHTLRRAHTVNDSVTSLREAYPQECFISTIDARERDIENGDIVLMSSPHGKVLRPAKVLPTVVPGGVALQDGSWINIDEESGIDIGGCPNILQAPKPSGQGIQTWTGTLVQVEKYTGPIKLEPDKRRALVLPKGIE